MAEYQITLDTAGGFSYSPDPPFWTSDPPEEPEPPPCPESGTAVPVTLQALLDGQTTTEPRGTMFSDEPTLSERLTRMIRTVGCP